VLLNGSAVSVNWEKANIPAIVEAWYPGQAAGTAIADVLFGDYNPAGRLPITFYKSVNDLPAFDNYDMSGRTYRYFSKEVLYPFGFGLSYTSFAYDTIKLNKKEILANESLIASVVIKNTGTYAGDEVVQLYISNPGSKRIHAIKSLKGFRRINLKAGESKTVNFAISADLLSNFDEKANAFLVEPGEYNILIGKSSADSYLQKTKLIVKQ